MKTRPLALVLTIVGLAACDPAASDDDSMTHAVELGPADGRDLPGTDLDRVQVGQTAPDFTLVSLAGAPVTLSSFRGRQNVVLVFYRGHW